MSPRDERNAKNQLQDIIDSDIRKPKVSKYKLTNHPKVLGFFKTI